MSALFFIPATRSAARVGIFLLLLVLAGRCLADEPGAETHLIQTAAEVRALTSAEADRHYPVKLRGEITFFDPALFYQFFQDDTAGIYLQLTKLPVMTPGQWVEIKGETSAGEFAPVVTPQEITILGTNAIPPALPVTFDQLISGEEDSQRVEVQGIVRSATVDPQTKYAVIEIASGGGRFKALIARIPANLQNNIVDSTVRVRGICASYFNLQRQLFDVRLLIAQPEDLVVTIPAPANPFAIPARPIEQLMQFTPHGLYGHRVKVRGVVTYYREGGLYIQDGQEGLYVETAQESALFPGDIVEVAGFPAMGDYTPMLQDAIFRKVGAGPLPKAETVSADDALKGTYDCRLVTIQASLLDRARHSLEQFIVLQSGGFIFHSYLERTNSGVDFAYLQNDSKVAVTGICRIERGNIWAPSADWRAKSFRLLMRSPADIEVLAQPPWWNFERMVWAVGILGVIVCSALAWVGILRRRVQKQTAIIQQRLQAEAALKERFENLLENASDLVFTLDLAGQITSINKAGEQLLRRQRGEILGKNLGEFVAEEQRQAVAHWLGQAAGSQDLPSVEWEFLNAEGQRIRLEISACLLRQTGREPEVESVARDITERKGLEREILEISNREQRRIGHDLHDGVCQQLAAIAYRMDILGDQLHEKGLPESVESERIAVLLQESIQQTRGVARGLFPVRLDESGLASALEELAANTTNFFRIQCRFFGEVQLSDKSVSLHLYYIAQEAVSNAVKHGRATQVTIAIAQTGDRLSLTIEDNGTGFHLPMTGAAGMGIRIMRYRARMIGATLDLKSHPGDGTQIICALYKAA